MSIYKGSQKVMGIVASQGEADLTEYQKKNDLTLNTTDKTVSGAINELKEAIDNGTGTEVPNPNIITYSSLEQLSLTSGTTTINIFNALPNNSLLRIEVTDNTIVTDIPENVKGVLIIDKNSSTGVNIEYKVVGGELYIGRLTIGEATTLSWKRVCTTTIADGKSGNKFFSGKLPSIMTVQSPYLNYTIKNGWCKIEFGMRINKTTGTCDYTKIDLSTVLTDTNGLLPKPMATSDTIMYTEDSATQQTVILLEVNSVGEFYIKVKGNNITSALYYRASIMYPLKEQ